jgi:release factor glutamine methyltransferase
MIVSKHLQQALKCLQNNDMPRLEAELLMSHVLKKNRSYLLAYPEHPLNTDQAEAFTALVARRVAGEPIAYLLGEREFWSLSLNVTPDTLIPRADTELLVEQALALLPKDAVQYVADLGTGSGAIALAITHERPHWKVTATDISEKALDVARGNAARHDLQRVHFAQGAWCDALPPLKYDAILSNPPYIDPHDPHLAEGDVRFEPASALVSGEHGLRDLRHIISHAPSHLKKSGWLLLEHGYDQGKAVREMMCAMGYHSVKTYVDLGGQERVSVGRV